MSTAKHTIELNRYTCEAAGIDNLYYNGYMLIRVGVFGQQNGIDPFDEERERVLRLIAAAPDLKNELAALIEGLELRGLLDGWSHDPTMVERARTLLKGLDNA